METLKGKIALVTGGNRGIGAACSLALANSGCDVAVNYNQRVEDAENTQAEVQKLGRRALLVQADVSQSALVQNMVARIEKELGPVSILANNAGMMRVRKPEDITEADWDEHINVNLKSAFLVTQAVPRRCESNIGDASLIFLRWRRRLAGSWGRTMLRRKLGCWD